MTVYREVFIIDEDLGSSLCAETQSWKFVFKTEKYNGLR